MIALYARLLVRPPLLDEDVPDISFREVEPEPIDFDALDANEPEPEPQPEPEPLRPAASLFERPRADPPPFGDPDHLLSRATDASVGRVDTLER